ncbi:hypothetical protein C4K40_5512 [Pseudomonas sp. CMR5c]|nr:hypothetical protein C4K40_5512 [Pseudomonas sp. CMR5c]
MDLVKKVKTGLLSLVVRYTALPTFKVNLTERRRADRRELQPRFFLLQPL